MKNFTLWLLRKIGRSIISMPKRHFKWYKHGIYYEPVLFLFYTLARFVTATIALVAISLTINVLTSQRTDNLFVVIIAMSYLYFVVEFISVIISIQYDKYCKELERTMNVLKTGVDDEYPYYGKEEDTASIHARLLAAQQTRQAQLIKNSQYSQYGGPVKINSTGRTIV